MVDEKKIYGRKFKWPKGEIIISSLSLSIAAVALIINKCSVDNTSKSLQIADSSFRLNADAFRVQAEPFIDVGNVRFEKVEVGQPITVHYTILNMGHGPALTTGVNVYTALKPFIEIKNLPVPIEQNSTMADEFYHYLYSESRTVDRTVQNPWQRVTQQQYDSLMSGYYKLWFEAHIYYIGSLPKTDTLSIDYASYTNRLRLDTVEEQRRVAHKTAIGWIDEE